MKTKLFWDFKYQVPIIESDNLKSRKSNSDTYFAKDARPVFSEEKYLLSLLFPEQSKKIMQGSVWFSSGNSYFVNGEKLYGSVYNRFLDSDLNELHVKVTKFKPSSELHLLEKEHFDNFIKTNRGYYLDLLNNFSKDDKGYPIGAIPFIREVIKSYSNRIPMVSFSGGKDSTVISHLVRSALGKNEVLHVFSDTTLEFPSTIKYINKMKANFPDIPFLIERVDENINNFFELSKKIGPPSRMKSWCCSIFKTGPMGNAFSQMSENWLTFYGIRRSESASRRKYLKVSKSPKLEMQVVASPIIDWKDIDVWLYILSERLDINIAYRQGFSRVGCWCCPNNSMWSDILMAVYNYDEYMKWHDFLVNFAKKIGKQDAEVYVAQGKWKARHGGAGIENDLMELSELFLCSKKINKRKYKIKKDVNMKVLSDFFKPFGSLEFNIGVSSKNEFIVLGINHEELLKVKLTNGRNLLIELLTKDFSNSLSKTNINQSIWSYIECQLRKYQLCINCKACKSTCPVKAIQVTQNTYIINEKLCINCLNCINHFPQGCLIASALETKRQEF